MKVTLPAHARALVIVDSLHVIAGTLPRQNLRNSSNGQLPACSYHILIIHNGRRMVVFSVRILFFPEYLISHRYSVVKVHDCTLTKLHF